MSDQGGHHGPDHATARRATIDPVAILIVEDDPFVLLHLEMMIERNGFGAITTASNVADALAAIETSDPDVAILDVNLRGQMVFPVARALRERGTPFAFVTAYANDAALFPPDLQDVPRCAKPLDADELMDTVRDLVGRR